MWPPRDWFIYHCIFPKEHYTKEKNVTQLPGKRILSGRWWAGNMQFHWFLNTVLRLAGPWDLGPGTFGCGAYTWTNVSWNNKMPRNYKGLKELRVCAVRDQIMDHKGTKTPETQLPLRTTGKSRVLHVFLHAKTIKGVSQPSEPLSPTSEPTPTLTP